MKIIVCFAAGVMLAGCTSAPPPDSSWTPVMGDQLSADVASGAPVTPSGVACLEPATRVYRRMSYDMPAGEYTSTLACEGEVWVARVTFDRSTSPSAGLMHEMEEMRFRAADLAIISSRHRQWQGPMEIEVELTQLAGRMAGFVRFPPEVFGEQEFDTRLPEGTLLQGMEEYLLATADLHDGWTATRPMFSVLPDRDEFLIAADELRRALREERPLEWSAFNVTIGGLTTLTYRVDGTQRVTVPAGTFSALRVEVTGEPQPRTIFVRRDPPHLVLRQEVPALQLTVELEEVRSP
jgi:hypothetical protein